ncbi:MAG: PEP-CTERM-box response regulator transcription factor [Alphaproteobacteria bacterium]
MSETSPASQNLLVVEDDEGLRRQYKWVFPELQLSLVGSREEALAVIRRQPVSVAIVDLGLPPHPDEATEGLATLAAIRELSPTTKVIIATGQTDRQYALRAIELGAYDFYEKPIEPDVLRLIVGRARNLFDLEAENARLAEARYASPIAGIIGSSPQIQSVLRTIEKVAPTDVSALLLGESGTGKELLARAIHALSPRAKEPFVALSCAAIPDTLFESELFGHEKGAFTGAVKQTIGKIESANKGTLFLDEIGDVPQPMQVKLLRFLQNQVIERIGGRRPIQVDVRVVCATHQNLTQLIAEGRFREDLYYRINEVGVQVPPLRERVGDAALLASYFLRRFAVEFRRPVRGFAPGVLAAIETHQWRGNVRELENRLKRAVIMTSGSAIGAADLELEEPSEPQLSLDLREARLRAERMVLQQALVYSKSNMSQAAKLLGISRPTLYDLIRQHGLTVDV